jgi:hypothetical protein
MQNNKIDFWFKIATIFSFILFGVPNEKHIVALILKIVLIILILICFVKIWYINKKPDFDIKIDRKQGDSLVFNFYNNSQYSVNLKHIIPLSIEERNIKCPAYFDTVFTWETKVNIDIDNLLVMMEIIETGTPISRMHKLSKKEIKILQQK